MWASDSSVSTSACTPSSGIGTIHVTPPAAGTLARALIATQLAHGRKVTRRPQHWIATTTGERRHHHFATVFGFKCTDQRFQVIPAHPRHVGKTDQRPSMVLSS